MTVLLVLVTLIMFLIADHFVQKSRERAAQLAVRPGYAPQEFLLPPNVALATNHTWMKNESKGITTVGLDEFLGRLVGAVEDIILPQVGASLSPATATISLKEGRNSLALAAPVSGRVVAINENVLRNPGLARTDPYGTGWLMKVQPDRHDEKQHVFSGSQAMEWLRKQTELAKEFLTVRMPQAGFVTMQDGGVPVDGLLKNYDTRVWEEFQQSFVTLR
jgi:glycine cleavage system H protein